MFSGADDSSDTPVKPLNVPENQALFRAARRDMGPGQPGFKHRQDRGAPVPGYRRPGPGYSTRSGEYSGKVMDNMYSAAASMASSANSLPPRGGMFR